MCQTHSNTNPVYHPAGMRGGVKPLGCEADRSQSSPEVTNTWIYRYIDCPSAKVSLALHPDTWHHLDYARCMKLHGLSPRAKYTDRATAACRRSDCQLFADRRYHVVSVTDPYSPILGFLDRSRYFSIK
jgi:hypothetical protein